MNLGATVRINRLGVCVLAGIFVLIVIYLWPWKDLDVDGPHRVNLRRLLVASVQAAERGGRRVALVRSRPEINSESKGKTREGAESLVTDADYSSHCVMYYGIKGIFPYLKVISEEKDKEKECSQLSPLELDPKGNTGVEALDDEEVDASKITVWIDPLDATQEFTENLLDCVTTMVCVAYEGNPIIGVIHKPFSQEPKTTWAWVNKGKSPNLKSVKKTYGFQSDSKTFLVSRSHSGNVTKIIKEKFGQEYEIVRSGGAGFKILEVIAGNASAYIHVTDIKKWDVCAGDAIITAVNGRLMTLDGKDLDYSAESSEKNSRGILASMGDIPEYIAKLKDIL
ncbi:hypothetical protein AAG570_013538 [Ranatra chinensis]|uniref:inositol-phosphate phosphatase n=1 Tax=Ranatra chinensis TaxID=642074 RepID=A0ABD0YCR3_9HEMI